MFATGAVLGRFFVFTGRRVMVIELGTSPKGTFQIRLMQAMSRREATPSVPKEMREQEASGKVKEASATHHDLSRCAIF